MFIVSVLYFYTDSSHYTLPSALTNIIICHGNFLPLQQTQRSRGTRSPSAAPRTAGPVHATSCTKPRPRTPAAPTTPWRTTGRRAPWPSTRTGTGANHRASGVRQLLYKQISLLLGTVKICYKIFVNSCNLQ